MLYIIKTERQVWKMSFEIFEKYESDVRSYCRKFPAVFDRAKGPFLYDENGREYIDFFCGAGALNYGHNNDYIKGKLVDYIMRDGVTHSLDMYTVAKREFIEYFEENILKPRGLDYVIQFAGPTGTNAVEAALKLARKVKNRSTVFALMGGFHGMTVGALELTTDKESRGGAGVSLGNVIHIPAPYMFEGFDTVAYMERLITDDHSGANLPAAIVLETTQAEGGIQVLSEDYLKAVRALCDKYGILMVVDDIQVGCGRTGYFFSFERAGIKPDMVCLSKSIGGYGTPLALTLFTKDLDKWLPGEHNGTFRGFQFATVCGKAALELMVNEKVDRQAWEKGLYVDRFLAHALPTVPHRGIGLIWGVDFEGYPEDTSKKVIAKCFEKGLICESAGRGNCVVKLMPELLIDMETLKKGLEIFCAATNEVLGL